MTALDPYKSPSPSRRALLAGALGGLGAVVATAIGRPAATRATDGGNALLGLSNTSTTETSFENTDAGEVSLGGHHIGSGIGVSGSSDSGMGVYAASDSGYGVRGGSHLSHGVYGVTVGSLAATVGHSVNNGLGVVGCSGVASVPAPKAKTGVYGYAGQDNASQGVWGHSPAGNGVVGSTTTGYAGYFSGKVYSTQFYELSEIGTPAAPAPNRARLFVKDNGAGKTQLCVRFHTGAVKVLVTEP